MFKIDPHALYSKDDLAAVLSGVCHIETFLRRIRPERILKNVYYGLDIIRAINRMQRVNEEGEVNPATPIPQEDILKIMAGNPKRKKFDRSNIPIVL